MQTVVPAADLAPTDRRAATHLLEVEHAAVLALLSDLHDADWHRPTDCARWDVAAVVSHLIGQAEELRRPWLHGRRSRKGRNRHPDLAQLDAHNEIQVEDHRHLSSDELRAQFEQQWPPAIRAASRLPGPLRRLAVSSGLPGVPRLRIGYLADVILARDLWMHRVDIGRAAGRDYHPKPHDRVIVEQVLRDAALEWAGPAAVLELTGAVSGSWQLGPGPAACTGRADTVDYLRTLAGRHNDPDLDLVAGDPTVVGQLRAARVIF